MEVLEKIVVEEERYVNTFLSAYMRRDLLPFSQKSLYNEEYSSERRSGKSFEENLKFSICIKYPNSVSSQ